MIPVLAAAHATGAVVNATGAVAAQIPRLISALYGMAGDISTHIDEHIGDMKGSENATVSRTGRVLEMAKFGFGIGYITPVAIIATGQLLLGNTLSAIGTVATAATLSNPIAMTCAALGAIYYGWSALSDVEREEILQKLSAGLEIGVELVKSIIRFVVESTKDLFSAKNIEEIKRFIGSAAAVFGKSLGDVTHKVGDVVGDTFDIVKKRSEDMLGKTKELAADTYRSVSATAGKAADGMMQTIEITTKKVGVQETRPKK